MTEYTTQVDTTETKGEIKSNTVLEVANLIEQYLLMHGCLNMSKEERQVYFKIAEALRRGKIECNHCRGTGIDNGRTCMICNGKRKILFTVK